MAVSCLLRLGHWLGESRYLAAAEKTLQAGWEQINQRPAAHDSLLAGLRSYFHPPVFIILRGESSLMTAWQQEFSAHYLPDHYCYALPGPAEKLPAALRKPAPESGVAAYICQGPVCREPVTSLAEFSRWGSKSRKSEFKQI